MAMKDLTTPFQRRRFLEYGSDGNKVVRHYHNVQQVGGTLYKGENKTTRWGETVYDLFILFPDVVNGLRYAHEVRDMGDSLGMSSGLPQSEQYLAFVKQNGLDSVEHFLQTMDARVTENRFIGNAQIAFARQFSPERAEVYAKHRAAYLEDKAEQAAQRQRELEAKAAEVERLHQEEERGLREQYLGWADTMTPMQFGRADSCLSKLIRVDGKVMPKRDFVIQMVKDGWLPVQKDGVTTWYGSRWDKRESKPRTEYHLQKENLSYKVSKTEYDFAKYIEGMEG